MLLSFHQPRSWCHEPPSFRGPSGDLQAIRTQQRHHPASLRIDEVASVENDATSSTRGSLMALLCTSKAISTEVKYTYQNREYQLCLSATGIVFEGICSIVSIACYCSGTWRTGAPRCNQCSKDLIWKVANSIHRKPLRCCDAVKGPACYTAPACHVHKRL
jgi:hypothetical protein